ncbi:DMT family transporter [Ruegeria atlantica]|uniref:DMT family transporter n=1 Tax=Ruegeria atlantica TaxID=81569 RepID=UPI00147EBFA1|nr:DMT family transporter [Ruegeria atlantica]
MTDTSIRSPFGSAQMTGVLIALAGATLMSFDAIFIRLSGVSGFDTAFLFGLFTALSMSIFIQLREDKRLIGTLRASGWPVIVSGLLMLGSATTLIFSLKNTSVANAIVILSTSPALAALFSWVFLGEVTRRATWIAIAAVMVGIAIVVSGSFGSGNLLGDALALIAVSFVSLNMVLLRRFQAVSRMASVGMGGLFLAIVMVFLATPSTYSASTWAVMAVMGLFTAPFGRVLSQVATRYITAPEVGMILMAEAVLAPLFAYGVFGEIPPLVSFAGGGVILVTLLTYTMLANRPSK